MMRPLQTVAHHVGARFSRPTGWELIQVPFGAAPDAWTSWGRPTAWVVLGENMAVLSRACLKPPSLDL